MASSKPSDEQLQALRKYAVEQKGMTDKEFFDQAIKKGYVDKPSGYDTMFGPDGMIVYEYDISSNGGASSSERQDYQELGDKSPFNEVEISNKDFSGLSHYFQYAETISNTLGINIASASQSLYVDGYTVNGVLPDVAFWKEVNAAYTTWEDFESDINFIELYFGLSKENICISADTMGVEVGGLPVSYAYKLKFGVDLKQQETISNSYTGDTIETQLQLQSNLLQYSLFVVGSIVIIISVIVLIKKK